MSQTIQDRRRHVVYVTKNTEYHCRDRECVGVRERSSGRWRRWHPALRTRLLGRLNTDAKVYRLPRTGFRLVFAGRQTVMTSKLEEHGRPHKESIYCYASLVATGEIQSA